MNEPNPVLPEDKWKERMDLAFRRCSEVIDLDQDPPVKHINIRAAVAQAELNNLDKLHKELLTTAREEERERVIDAVIKVSDQYWIDKRVGQQSPLIVNKPQFKEFVLYELTLQGAA